MKLLFLILIFSAHSNATVSKELPQKEPKPISSPKPIPVPSTGVKK